jgi:signal transduction histidine kinase
LQASKERVEAQAYALQTANKRLEDMGALKDEFIAKVSHELRTPLTSIKEGLSLLLDEVLGATSEQQRDFLSTMNGDVDRLAEFINNMLDVSKIESGRMRFQRRRLSLVPL